MCRKSWIAFAIATTLVMSGRAAAGGPPWLCLPVDGVTKETASECSELLTAKLNGKRNLHLREGNEVRVFPRGDQWYAAFYMGDEDVRLSDVDAALKGSKFSTPHDRLRVFGHAVLEIDAKGAPAKELLTALELLDHTTVVDSKVDSDRLMVTVAMPYPASADREYWQTESWRTFNRTMEGTDHAGIPAEATTADRLPSYKTFGEVAAKHNASVKDLRWSTVYACRPVGGVALPKDATVASASR